MGEQAEAPAIAFRAPTFTEAIQQVYAALGPDALILDRRQCKCDKPGVLGGSDEMVEILAAPPQAKSASSPRPTLLERVYGGDAGQSSAGKSSSGQSFTSQGLAARLERLCEQITANVREEMRRFIEIQARGSYPAVRADLIEIYQQMVSDDVAPALARALVERLAEIAPQATVEEAKAALLGEIAQRIAVSGHIALSSGRPAVAALIGPTGVGKTTTLAKIAVDFTYRRLCKVAIINEDARRPGAAAQLQGLAHLLSVPLVAAETPERALEEVTRLSDRDLILVDTAGRSPRDERGIRELTNFLAALRPDETHLVLAADGAERHALEAAEHFRAAGWNRIAITKLDEVSAHGVVLNIAARLAAPLSYIATGQEYIEALAAAESTALARLILRRATIKDLHTAAAEVK